MLFVEVFQLVTKEEKAELEYHHFSNPTKSVDLGYDHQ